MMHEALRGNPELFFELPKALQNDPVLRMASYLCAHLEDDQDLCQRLLDEAIQPSCLSTFAGQINELKDKWGLDESFFSKNPELGNNLETMSALIISTNQGNILKFASDPLKKNSSFVLLAVTHYGWALCFAAPELQHDPKFVLAAVTKHGWALEFAAPELQHDPKIVLAAVTQDGMVLEIASPELRDNPEIVQAAIRQNPKAIQFASPGCKKYLDDSKIYQQIFIQSDGIRSNSSCKLYGHASIYTS